MILTQAPSQTTPSQGPPPGIKGPLVDSISPYLGLELTTLALLGAGALWKFILQPRVSRVSHSLSYSIEKENNIRGILYQLLDNTGAERATLLAFRNGDKLLSGNPLYKVFAMDEALQPGVSPIAETFKDIPSARLSGLLKKLKDDARVRLNQPPTDEFLAQLFLLKGIGGAYAIMLEDTNERPVGVVLLTFSRHSMDNLAALDIVKVMEKCSVIEALLTERINRWLSVLLNKSSA